MNEYYAYIQYRGNLNFVKLNVGEIRDIDII